MRGLRNVISTSLATALVALLLACLPRLDRVYKPGGETTVFSPAKGAALSDRNLIGRMAALPLQLRIAKVDLQSSVLFVDLLVTPATMAKDTVYHDLYELSRFGISETPNVNQVMVRILRQPTNSKRDAVLLAALDARRDAVAGGLAAPAEGAVTDVENYLSSRYRLSYTQEWKQFFRM